MKRFDEMVAMRRLIFLLILATTILFPIKLMAAQHIVCYFDFEGSGDTMTDRSGNGNDGLVEIGEANRVEGKYGQGVQFSDTRIMIPESETLTLPAPGAVTLMWWMKKANEEGGKGNMGRIVSKEGHQHDLAMDNLGWRGVVGGFGLNFAGSPDWMTVFPVPLDWHHIAISFDGASETIRAYLDGVMEFELIGFANAAREFTGAVFLGAHPIPDPAEFYDGDLDEFKYFAGVLDQPTIQANMAGGTAVDTSGKLAMTWGSIKSQVLK
jgi:hypothetical protein